MRHTSYRVSFRTHIHAVDSKVKELQNYHLMVIGGHPDFFLHGMVSATPIGSIFGPFFEQ